MVFGRYSKTKVLTDFMAVLPADQPRYLLLIMLDEPQALPETHGFKTSGWNAVPTGGVVRVSAHREGPDILMSVEATSPRARLRAETQQPLAQPRALETGVAGDEHALAGVEAQVIRERHAAL